MLTVCFQLPLLSSILLATVALHRKKKDTKLCKLTLQDCFCVKVRLISKLLTCAFLQNIWKRLFLKLICDFICFMKHKSSNSNTYTFKAKLLKTFFFHTHHPPTGGRLCPLSLPSVSALSAVPTYTEWYVCAFCFFMLAFL